MGYNSVYFLNFPSHLLALIVFLSFPLVCGLQQAYIRLLKVNMPESFINGRR